MEIIEMYDNEELIKESSSLGNFFLDMFGEGTIGILAISDDDGEIGFVGLKEGDASYVRRDNDTIKHIDFGYDKEFNLSYLVSDDIVYAFEEDSVCCNDRNAKIIKELSAVKLSEPDKEGFDSNIVYLQINPEKRTSLDLRYQSNSYYHNGSPYIYSYRLKDFNFAYLTDNNKIGLRILPGLGNRYQFYVGSLVRNKMMNDDFSSEKKERYAMRYYRMTHLVNGVYSDSIFSFNGISKDELYSLISSYGFDTRIPDRLVDIYNKEDKEYLFVVKVIEEIKKIMANKDENKKARMVLSMNN